MEIPRRGILFTRDGKQHEVPVYLLDQKEITWPPTLPVKEPGQPTKYFSAADFYRRHEIIEGKGYLFLPNDSLVTDVPDDVLDGLFPDRQR